MVMDLRELRRLAAENELSLNFIYKDLMISKALFGLQGNDKLILKGGTAINRIYLKDKKRFSEDLDFDYVFNGSPKGAIPNLKNMVSGLSDFNIARTRIMNQTVRFDAYFVNPLNIRDRVMLEFRITKKAKAYDKTVVNYGFVPSDSSLVNVYVLEALFKQKLECVKNRRDGKDFYDLYYMADMCKIKITKTEVREIIERLNLSPREIRDVSNSTNHYIRRMLRPEWETFINELKEKLKNLSQ